MSEQDDGVLRETAEIIEAFGGIRPMAHKLGVPVSTVQGWKQRNAIPDNRVGDIFAAAAEHGVDRNAITVSPGDASPSGAEAPPEAGPVAGDGEPGSTPLSPSAGAPTPGEARHTGADQPAPKGPPSSRAALAVALLALIVAVASAGWLILGRAGAPPAGTAELTQQLAALEARIEAASAVDVDADLAEIRAQIASLSAAPAIAPRLADEVDTLSSKLASVEMRLGALESATGDELAAAQDVIQDVQGEIAELRRQFADLRESRAATGPVVSRAVALALAAGRLQRAVAAGRPYSETLASLRDYDGDDAVTALRDRLARYAATGVATKDALIQRFAPTARAVVAAASGDAAESWTDRALSRLSSVVTIRPVGPEVAGGDPAARLARAEAQLQTGDLAGAVAELDGMTGAAAAAAADWLADARARLDADAAVDALETLAVTRLQTEAGLR